MPAAWCLLAVGLAAIVFIPRQDPTVGRSACRATASVIENPAQPPFSVTCFDNDPSQAARSADALAEQYVAARRADLRRQADAQYADAHARTEKARRDEDQSTVRWLAAKLQASQAEHRDAVSGTGYEPAKKRGQDGPATIENPKWSALQRQRAELGRHREELLIRYTTLHPAVLNVDARIESVKSVLDATPQRIPNPAFHGASGADGRHGLPTSEESMAKAAMPGRASGAEQTKSILAELSAVLDAAHHARQQAESAEQQAVEQRDAGTQLAIEPARAVPCALETTQRQPPPVAWTTLVAGLMMAVGVGLVSVARSAEPPLASLREIQFDLGETPIQTPIQTPIHVVETDDPVPDFAALKRQRFLHRAAIVAGWCLLIVFLSRAILARG
jgi:hypothetical protein